MRSRRKIPWELRWSPVGLIVGNPMEENPEGSRRMAGGNTRGSMGPREIPQEHAGSHLVSARSYGKFCGISWDPAVGSRGIAFYTHGSPRDPTGFHSMGTPTKKSYTTLWAFTMHLKPTHSYRVVVGRRRIHEKMKNQYQDF